MQEILSWYLCNKDWIDLVKDLVFFFGAYQVIKFIWTRKFVINTQEIAKNLKVREEIEEKLREHVLTETKNGIKGFNNKISSRTSQIFLLRVYNPFPQRLENRLDRYASTAVCGRWPVKAIGQNLPIS